MKIYAVCWSCGDDYYGFNAPKKIFSTKEKAEAWLKKQEEVEIENGEFIDWSFLAPTKVKIIEYELC